MVHGLLGGEAGDGGKHAEGIAAEQDEILGVRAHTGDVSVGNVLDGVRCARVLRHSTARQQFRSVNQLGQSLGGLHNSAALLP